MFTNDRSGGTLTLGALPDGLTLTDTGKPIDGWYKDMRAQTGAGVICLPTRRWPS